MSPKNPLMFERIVIARLAKNIKPSSKKKYSNLTLPPLNLVVNPSIRPLVKNGVARFRSDKIITKIVMAK